MGKKPATEVREFELGRTAGITRYHEKHSGCFNKPAPSSALPQNVNKENNQRRRARKRGRRPAAARKQKTKDSNGTPKRLKNMESISLESSRFGATQSTPRERTRRQESIHGETLGPMPFATPGERPKECEAPGAKKMEVHYRNLPD